MKYTYIVGCGIKLPINIARVVNKTPNPITFSFWILMSIFIDSSIAPKITVKIVENANIATFEYSMGALVSVTIFLLSDFDDVNRLSSSSISFFLSILSLNDFSSSSEKLCPLTFSSLITA
ncbi:MAG: hypothetical protein IPN08_08360 [Bacteroidales bacterium]|nr:hypothetical protein [Bacteroidales bacterium]